MEKNGKHGPSGVTAFSRQGHEPETVENEAVTLCKAKAMVSTMGSGKLHPSRCGLNQKIQHDSAVSNMKKHTNLNHWEDGYGNDGSRTGLRTVSKQGESVGKGTRSDWPQCTSVNQVDKERFHEGQE